MFAWLFVITIMSITWAVSGLISLRRANLEPARFQRR
jgi:hypothetical protein